MSDILKQIVENKQKEVDAAINKVSLAKLKAFIETVPESLDFAKALDNPERKQGRIIAECKKKSPSKGILVKDYDAPAIAKLYEKGGASCVSVLSDEKYFAGSLEDVQAVKQNVKIPVIRKDFIIDEYQIYEARRFGADSYLLIAGLLDTAKLQYFIEIGRDLGMEPLVETHSGDEVEIALRTDCKIIGINNRNLKTMGVDLSTALNLGREIQRRAPERILVCESGISQRAHVVEGLASGFSAFLIGEALVKSFDPVGLLRELIG